MTPRIIIVYVLLKVGIVSVSIYVMKTSKSGVLTHYYDSLWPNDAIYLGQHWFKLWIGASRHQAIT